MMNMLIFDEEGKLSPLIKSIVGGYDARISASTDAKDARIKLDTGLFDAVIVNVDEQPSRGSATKFLSFMRESFSFLPVVVVDRKGGCEAPNDQTILVIQRPLMTNDIVKAIFKLRQYIGNTRPEQVAATPPMEIEIAAAGGSVACSCRHFSDKSALLESRGAEPASAEELHRFFSDHERDLFEAVVPLPNGGRRIGHGRAIFHESSPTKMIRAVGVVFEDEWKTVEAAPREAPQED